VEGPPPPLLLRPLDLQLGLTRYSIHGLLLYNNNDKSVHAGVHPDPHSFSLSWIRIRIGNANPDPGA
jgi:hypothetical protein